jgi:hypothetical protein
MKVLLLSYALVAIVFSPIQIVWAEDDHNLDLLDNNKEIDHQSMSPAKADEAKRIGRLLDDLYADCGRYPTTKEWTAPRQLDS